MHNFRCPEWTVSTCPQSASLPLLTLFGVTCSPRTTLASGSWAHLTLSSSSAHQQGDSNRTLAGRRSCTLASYSLTLSPRLCSAPKSDSCVSHFIPRQPRGRTGGRAHNALPHSRGRPGKRGLAGGSGDPVLAWSPIRQRAIASPPATARPPSQCVAAFSPAPRASLFQPALLWHGCWRPRGPAIGGCPAPEPRAPQPSRFRSSVWAHLAAGRREVARPPARNPSPQLARPEQAGTLQRRRACLSHSDCRLCCVGRRGCLKRRANPSHRLHQASGSEGSPHGLCSPVPGTRGRKGPGGDRRNATGHEWAGQSGRLAPRKWVFVCWPRTHSFLQSERPATCTPGSALARCVGRGEHSILWAAGSLCSVSGHLKPPVSSRSLLQRGALLCRDGTGNRSPFTQSSPLVHQHKPVQLLEGWPSSCLSDSRDCPWGAGVI